MKSGTLTFASLLTFTQVFSQTTWVTDSTEFGHVIKYEVATAPGVIVKYVELWNGNVRTEGFYKDGKKTGVWTFHWLNGERPAFKVNYDSIYSDNSIALAPQDTMKEIMPEFPGGMPELHRILSSIPYPENLGKVGVEGEVIIDFTVSSEGYVKDVIIRKHAHPLMEAEVIKTIQSLPRWDPGIKNGERVPVLFEVPVKFKMDRPRKIKKK